MSIATRRARRKSVSTARVIPAHAVAALFIERQHLERPGRLVLGSRTLDRFVADVGGLQIDSINVLDRAHHLTLWSRFGAYDRATLTKLIERDRVVFEYWAHAACFVPASHAHAWRRAMLDYRVRHTGWPSWLKKNNRLLDEIESAIRERGPLGNSDFERKRGRGGGWWTWKPATHALHFLWMSGRTMVESRKHFQKRFDLAERVLPAIATITPLESEEFPRWHMRQSLHAMGAATEQDLHWYLTFPRVRAVKRRATLQAMVRAGEVMEVAIEGDKAKWYALPEDLPALERAADRRAGLAPSSGTTLLAPFDSFLWHRARTKRLFHYDYTIEVYVPDHKRVHGYYSLPILHEGRLIGRLDAKNHREAKRLEVRRVNFEPWFASGAAAPIASWGAIEHEAAFEGIAGALASLATFVDAKRTTLGRVSPAKLKAPLARAMRER
jgi:uncharacterized protein YcaQ